ncbi:lipoyl(octanoyl) transferase LipB [Plasticicumulans acidivorans]|uniref:Octanoyltransferase n=1 Tax=Plasticicumulans acidivorans TaxID=886464 RepID=A0A317MPR8_9GAMM|nr:lipoyl(octanoyl) transferase LipB [Plasticicumulans acidivorans]PWV58380.1 lipoyl(octanoyl) transferase [Plasticicumulans acidivorans]
MKPRCWQVRQLGLQPYARVFAAMKRFTAERDEHTADEVWVVQHPPVFTQGLNGKPEHLLATGDIPVVNVDRGGQVTYHGPGQAVLYPLLDITRAGIGVRELVSALENTVVQLLAERGVSAYAKPDAPGVYVDGRKIASLGLRVRKGRCYHGLAVNVDMDLAPFLRINPCGYPGLEMTQMRTLGLDFDMQKITSDLLHNMAQQLGYTATSVTSSLPAALIEES